jgi:hypothetical protein
MSEPSDVMIPPYAMALDCYTPTCWFTFGSIDVYFSRLLGTVLELDKSIIYDRECEGQSRRHGIDSWRSLSVTS